MNHQSNDDFINSQKGIFYIIKDIHRTKKKKKEHD